MTKLKAGDYIDLTGSDIEHRFDSRLLVIHDTPTHMGPIAENSGVVWTNMGFISRKYAEAYRSAVQKGDRIGDSIVSGLRWNNGSILVDTVRKDTDEAQALRMESIKGSIVESDMYNSGSADYGDSDTDDTKFSEGDSVVFTGDDTAYNVTYVYDNRVAYDLYAPGEFGPYSVPERLLERAPEPVEPAQIWVEKVPDTEMGTDPGKDRCSIFITRVDDGIATYAGTWDHYTSTSSVSFIRDHYYLKKEE